MEKNMFQETLSKKLSRKPKWKIENLQLPRYLTDEIDSADFSIAVDCIELAVIEIADCVDSKIDRSVERLIDEANIGLRSRTLNASNCGHRGEKSCWGCPSLPQVLCHHERPL
jgi:hypothetical protein